MPTLFLSRHPRGGLLSISLPITISYQLLNLMHKIRLNLLNSLAGINAFDPIGKSLHPFMLSVLCAQEERLRLELESIQIPGCRHELHANIQWHTEEPCKIGLQIRMQKLLKLLNQGTTTFIKR